MRYSSARKCFAKSARENTPQNDGKKAKGLLCCDRLRLNEINISVQVFTALKGECNGDQNNQWNCQRRRAISISNFRNMQSKSFKFDVDAQQGHSEDLADIMHISFSQHLPRKSIQVNNWASALHSWIGILTSFDQKFSIYISRIHSASVVIIDDFCVKCAFSVKIQRTHVTR